MWIFPGSKNVIYLSIKILLRKLIINFLLPFYWGHCYAINILSTTISIIFILVQLICRYESQLENLRQQSFNMEQTNFATQTLKDTKVTVSIDYISLRSHCRTISHPLFCIMLIIMMSLKVHLILKCFFVKSQPCTFTEHIIYTFVVSFLPNLDF